MFDIQENMQTDTNDTLYMFIKATRYVMENLGDYVINCGEVVQ